MRLKFWGKSRGFRGAMDEILSFGGPGKLNLAAALKGAKDRKKEEVKPKSAKWSSSTHSDSDEDDDGRVRRRRKRRTSERVGVAARLKQQAAALEQCLLDTPSSHNRGDRSDSSEEKKQVSRSPSPIPSPPPLVFYTAPDSKQSQTLLKADQMLQELKQPQCLSDSLMDQSCSLLEISEIASPLSLDQTLTLRVRCRGKIYRFTVNKDDPLVLLCTDLGKELGVKGEQILLSHSTATLSTAASPATLGLSTADIIDAIVVLEDQLLNGELDSSTTSLDSEDSISLKIQSSKKTAIYSIAKTGTLSRIMTAFAATLGMPVNMIKFTFDGDPISPDHTPNDLDMENSDIIDARLLTS